jgi:hypothetical protein
MKFEVFIILTWATATGITAVNTLPNLPGKKIVGWPRSGSSGPNLFFGPTGMVADVGALFWYPKRAKRFPFCKTSTHSAIGVSWYTIGVGVWVGVKVAVGVLVGVAVGVGVFVGVAVGVFVGVRVGVLVGVAVGVGVRVGVGVDVGVAVLVGVGVNVLVGVDVGVGVASMVAAKEWILPHDRPQLPERVVGLNRGTISA